MPNKEKKRKIINKKLLLLPISLLILLLILITIQIVIIYTSFKNLFPLEHCFAYFIADFYFITVILFFLTIINGIKNNKIIYICDFCIILLVILFTIDIFTIYYFQSHETILSLLEYIKYGGNGFTGIITIRILGFLLIRGIMIIGLQHTNVYIRISNIFTPKMFLIIYICAITIQCFQSLTTRIPTTENILSTNLNFIKNIIEQDIPLITDKQYNPIYETGDKKEINIIIIFSESLSAIDSAQLGGNNNMPLFDTIQKKGLTLPHFMASGNSSMLAHESVFLGVIPINHYESHTLGLPKIFNNLGYNTIYISAVPLTFLNERTHLHNIGFKSIIGEEGFTDKIKYSRNSAPDEDLYKKVLDEIKKQTGKYFISLATISFHSPYNTPYGKTEAQALKYSDEKLYDFYISLDQLNFFDSGILIIIGDHRKREPAEKGEYELFGDARKYKSAATIIGTGIVKGSINNNLIQQTDFYYSLKKLIGSGNIEVDPFYNNIFSGASNRSWGITNKDLIIKNGDTYEILKLEESKNKYPEIFGYQKNLKKKSIISKKI